MKSLVYTKMSFYYQGEEYLYDTVFSKMGVFLSIYSDKRRRTKEEG